METERRKQECFQVLSRVLMTGVICVCVCGNFLNHNFNFISTHAT